MNYELLRRKFLLLDTNILVYYSKFTQPFKEYIFNPLESTETILIISDLVKFEFMRGSAKPSESGALKQFLKLALNQKDEQINSSQFPSTHETINTGIEISNLYSWKLKNHKISLVDCMIAAEMKKYNERSQQLFLATTDHDHFPNLLFDRMGITTIDTGESIFNVGFYSFNHKRYTGLRAQYDQVI